MSEKKKKTGVSPNGKYFQSFMEDILARCTRYGASDAAVSVHQDSGLSVDVRMQSVETVLFHEDKGISLTVYYDHQIGSASGTDFSEESIDYLIASACEIAKVSAVDPCFGLADKKYMSTEHPDLALYYPWDITPDEAIARAIACESKALALDKRIHNSDGVNLAASTFLHGYANTHGALGVVRASRHSMSCSLIAEASGKMQRDYDYTVARNADLLLSGDLLAELAVTRTVARLGARKIKTAKMPVVFDVRCSGSLMRSFISAISGSNLYRKNTFLLDARGQQIFPDWLDIFELPRIPGGLGSASFDADGIPTRDNVFVKNGIIEQYVLGVYSARRLGLETTANADGVHNLRVTSNAGTLSDILEQMGSGLLVTELMGQGVNLITGDYSKGASGFWVEDGKIQFPVEEITIAGNLKTMFRNIRAIGCEFDPNSSLHCGPVWISEMMVGGD